MLLSGCAPLRFTIEPCIDDQGRLTSCQCQAGEISLGEEVRASVYPGEKPVVIPPMVPRGRWFVVSTPLDRRIDETTAHGWAHCNDDRIDADVVLRRHVGKGDAARAEYLAYFPPPDPHEANSRDCTFYMAFSIGPDQRRAEPRAVHLVHRIRLAPRASADGRWHWSAPTPTDGLSEFQLEPPPAPVSSPECR